MSDYHYSPYQDNKTYDANAPYRQSSGGYGYPPQSPPPQDNNTVKIIMIVAGAVIAIAVMVVVAIVILNSQKDTPADNPPATVATVTGLNDAQGSTASVQKMPDLSGLSKEDAISRLSAMGVTVKEIKETETDKAKPGYVFDQVPARNHEIKAGEEVTLYVAKQKATQAVKQTSATAVTPTSVTYMYCTANDFVSLRTGKGTSYTELAKIPRGGSMVYVRPDGNWYYVRYGSLEGYVHGDYVSFNIGDVPANVPAPKANTLVCTADDFVSLRTGPHKSYRELAKIPRGGTMTFINYSDVDSNWYYVQYGNTKGFVYSEYVAFI